MKQFLALAVFGCIVGLVPAMAQQLPQISKEEAQEVDAKRAELFEWEALKFLLGKWKGQADGTMGHGPGTLEVKTELDGKIVTARNEQIFFAPDGEGYTYHSLMTIYLSGIDRKAMFFDNEGHVIRYDVQLSTEPRKVTFVSVPMPFVPRFRFSYTDKGDGSILVNFESAPANDPEAFVPYVGGTIRRVSRHRSR